ncbi:MAG: alpha-2-macroglobulin family protein [Niabella sp.]
MKTFKATATIIIFFIVSVMKTNAQIKNYEEDWKTVEASMQQGLPATALETVKKIYSKAKREQQQAQLIKAVIYITQLQQENREDNLVQSINDVEQEIQTTREPVTSLLNSYLAGLYQQYFQANRYKLYNRTNTTDFNKADIATWTTDDFTKKISGLYLASLKNSEILQQTNADAYDALIVKGNTRYLRPTLYDLLAQRALIYFKSDEHSVTRPADAFEIDQPAAFSPAHEFAEVRFETKDSLSLQYKALLIYQDLIRFHLKDTKPDALIDVDLARLEYVNQKAVFPVNNTAPLIIIDGKPAAGMNISPEEIESINVIKDASATAIYGSKGANGVIVIQTRSGNYTPGAGVADAISDMDNKDLLYYNALQQIAEKYSEAPAAAQAWYLMAQWHQQKGITYNAHTDTTNRYELVKAKEISDKILAQKKESEGWINAYNLNKQLQSPSLSFEVERVNIPDLPFRMLVHFKNTDKIYLRVVPATQALKDAAENTRDVHRYWSALAAAAPAKSWEQSLPANNDLQAHTAEIKIDGYTSGEYFVLASLNKDFGTESNILAARLVYISNISFVNNNNDFFVLNRNTGQPLENASVQVWQKSYDYKAAAYKKQKAGNYTTDKNGYFRFAEDSENRKNNNIYLFEIRYNDEKLFLSDNESQLYLYNSFNNAATAKKVISTFLFTDRSLYRPGQTVYFKGIVINRDPQGKNQDILSTYQTTVTLFDANHQKIDSLPVTTNEYGSFNGSFKLPEGGLNGVLTLSTAKNTGSASFRMEAYKRPRFYVDFEKLKGAYKVNDNIKVTGTAKAYAGNNVDGATVKYRVVREARFPYPWLFWRGYWPQSSPLEITHGETTTNADGKFDIFFKAIPDLKLSEKTDPVFDYKIYADVTDINGETRSGTQQVTAGYKSLLLKTSLAERIPADSLKTIYIQTENMAGEFEKADINIRITRINPEQRLLRPRYWEKADQYVMTREEYIRNFPNDIYADEDDPKSWTPGSVAFEQSGNTDSTGTFTLKNHQLNKGFYMFEVSTKDRNGKEIKNVQYFELYSNNGQTPAKPAYLYTTAPKATEPGEKAIVEIGTSAKNVFVIQTVNKKDKNYSFFKLDNENKKVAFETTATDRGGYGIGYLFVKNNRVFQYNEAVNVPWTNKDLKIAYSTFRDKTLPGAAEKWTVQISGYKKEKVAAEMLAGMYDASLDQFYMHQWYKPAIWYNYYNNNLWNGQQNFGDISSSIQNSNNWNYKSFDKRYDWIFSDREYGDSYQFGVPGIISKRVTVRGASTSIQNIESSTLDEVVTISYGSAKKKSVTGAVSTISNDAMAPAPKKEDEKQEHEVSPDNQVAVRTNFNETAFFFPDLKTDKDGNISFSFTMPEALTRWKFQALAHTKELALGYSQKEIVTQKDLMVQPNPPRFLREGDKMEFSSKVVNLSDKEITGIATLQLFDTETNEAMDGWFKNVVPQQYFTIAAGKSESIKFPVEVPYQYNKALTWRIVAKATNAAFSDGEENILPVLTNRILVTETLPLNMRGSGTKNFKLDKLVNSGSSETLTTQSLTVEYTSNPAWYAVQALPYMMEYPYECAEQTWNRYYANSLATMIASSSPKIKQVFEKWKTTDTTALLSNLQKNEALKTILLEETPWVLAAKSEAQQKKNIAVLFDLVRMSGELNKAYGKLRQMQSSNGGFVWFKGGPDDRYITQYIVTGIGHLKKLNATEGLQEANLNRIAQAALPYLDGKIKEEYDNLVKYKTDLNKYVPSYYAVQYLYMRSFFPEVKIATSAQKAVSYFKDRTLKTWVQQNKYMQGMIALAAHRSNDAITPKAILRSLKETAINNDEMGMYYKDASRGWWWYQAPVERQALIIEAFEEINKDEKTADDLRTWLLKNKQTNNWESTKATAEACYALLLKGTQWLSVTPDISLDLGGTIVNNKEEKTEEGTGYFKKTIEGSKVRPAMGNIDVTVQQPDAAALPTWGGVYWQYFEDLDKITTAETPLKLQKRLFVETNTDQGPVLKPVNEGATIKVGDKIKVRIELRVDRDMEYVHMKDMRAAALEPTNVLSSYKWQGGLGYYETTKDAGTHFFFNYLPKGTYVFEYSLFAGMAGDFSNGITTIECMYAPEFTSHSEGIRVRVQ